MKLTLKKTPDGFFPVGEQGKKYWAALNHGDEAEVEIEDGWEKQKTETQRAALHVWFELLAKILNEAGFDMTVFLRDHAKAGIQVPWTKNSVKEVFYKPTLAAMTGKHSTEHMNTVEPSQICDVVGATLSQRLGITPPEWPSRFNQGSDWPRKNREERAA